MDGNAILIAPASLHQQVTDDLLSQIETGSWAPGSMIPTEAALCTVYGVSRITVRRALAVLVARGLVTRRRGIGSFVTGRTPGIREFHLVGFLDDRMEYDHQMLLDEATVADKSMAAALGLEPGSALRHIRSIVHRQGQPFTLTDAYTADLPNRRVQAADYRAGLPSAQAMGQRLGQRILRAEQEMDAVAADALAAEHLGVASGTPIIRARRTYFAAADLPFQYLVVRYHPDRYQFVVDLVPRAGTTAYATRATMEDLP